MRSSRMGILRWGVAGRARVRTRRWVLFPVPTRPFKDAAFATAAGAIPPRRATAASLDDTAASQFDYTGVSLTCGQRRALVVASPLWRPRRLPVAACRIRRSPPRPTPYRPLLWVAVGGGAGRRRRLLPGRRRDVQSVRLVVERRGRGAGWRRRWRRAAVAHLPAAALLLVAAGGARRRVAALALELCRRR